MDVRVAELQQRARERKATVDAAKAQERADAQELARYGLSQRAIAEVLGTNQPRARRLIMAVSDERIH